MFTRDQAVHCLQRVRRMEDLMRRAENSVEKPADYQLLQLMLQQLRQRERTLLAELTPEERLEVREEIERQEMLSRLSHLRNEAKANDDDEGRWAT